MIGDRLTQLRQACRVVVVGQKRGGRFQSAFDVMRPCFERERAGVGPADPKVGDQSASVGIAKAVGPQGVMRKSARRFGRRTILLLARRFVVATHGKKGRVRQVGGDECSHIGPRPHIAFRDQALIGEDRRIAGNAQLDAQLAGGRQRIAALQSPVQNHRSYLVENLILQRRLFRLVQENRELRMSAPERNRAFNRRRLHRALLPAFQRILGTESIA